MNVTTVCQRHASSGWFTKITLCFIQCRMDCGKNGRTGHLERKCFKYTHANGMMIMMIEFVLMLISSGAVCVVPSFVWLVWWRQYHVCKVCVSDWLTAQRIIRCLSSHYLSEIPLENLFPQRVNGVFQTKLIWSTMYRVVLHFLLISGVPGSVPLLEMLLSPHAETLKIWLWTEFVNPNLKSSESVIFGN